MYCTLCHSKFVFSFMADICVLLLAVHSHCSAVYMKADVYVNAANQMLDLKHDAVSQSLLKAGGSTIQDECNWVVASRGTIPYWDIATTSGGKLQCQHIIHTVGANYKGIGCKKVCTSTVVCVPLFARPTYFVPI